MFRRRVRHTDVLSSMPSTVAPDATAAAILASRDFCSWLRALRLFKNSKTWSCSFLFFLRTFSGVYASPRKADSTVIRISYGSTSSQGGEDYQLWSASVQDVRMVQVR